MKRFIVEQTGYIQVEVTRIFVVEVADDMTEEEAEELVEELQDKLPEDEDMAWKDDLDGNWIGYIVEFTATEVYNPDAVIGGPKTEGLKVISLEATRQ